MRLANTDSCLGVKTLQYLLIGFDTMLAGLILFHLLGAPGLYVENQTA
jgi:hypothetical protein